jgi:hypothetical protein
MRTHARGVAWGSSTSPRKVRRGRKGTPARETCGPERVTYVPLVGCGSERPKEWEGHRHGGCGTGTPTLLRKVPVRIGKRDVRAPRCTPVASGAGSRTGRGSKGGREAPARDDVPSRQGPGPKGRGSETQTQRPAAHGVWHGDPDLAKVPVRDRVARREGPPVHVCGTGGLISSRSRHRTG